MTGKERVRLAMQRREADRVPVFCQLALGHYMLQTPFEPYAIWYSPNVFAEALVMLARRYRFDGVLVNLPGRPRNWEALIERREQKPDGSVTLHWTDGTYSVCPPNDNVHHFTERPRPAIVDVNPDDLYYVEPHSITSPRYPFAYDFGELSSARDESFFPPYAFDTLVETVRLAGDELHVSAELFSPFAQLLELYGYSEALISLMTEPDLVDRNLAALAQGSAELAVQLARRGPDAILVSSPFAGGGFISREHYRRFVFPYERHIVERVHRDTKLPIYVHTCGNIGDRIDLIVEAGYDGVDTMDPPPLGDTDISVVKRQFGDRLFLKGNIDPVNLLLQGTVEQIDRQSDWLIENAGAGGGYILSSACSVAPQVEPSHIERLYEASVRYPYR